MKSKTAYPITTSGAAAAAAAATRAKDRNAMTSPPSNTNISSRRTITNTNITIATTTTTTITTTTTTTMKPSQIQTNIQREYKSNDINNDKNKNKEKKKREREKESDYIIIIEFSEAVGPVPVVTLPYILPESIDLKRFGLRVMVSDFRKKKSHRTLPTVNVADMDQLFQDFHNHLFIYCHYTAIADFGARGYTRAICMCYVSQTPRKIEQVSKQLKQGFQSLAHFLKQCAQQVFLREVQSVIQELLPLQPKPISSTIAETESEENITGEGKIKKTFKNVQMSTDEELTIESDTEETTEKSTTADTPEGEPKQIRVRSGKKVRYHDTDVEFSDLFQAILTPDNVQDIILSMREVLGCFESELQEVHYENPLQSKYIGSKDITCKLVDRYDNNNTTTGGNDAPRTRYRPMRLGHDGYRPFTNIIGGADNYREFEQRLKQIRVQCSKNSLDIFINNINQEMSAALDKQRLFVVGSLCSLDLQPGHTFSPSWLSNGKENEIVASSSQPHIKTLSPKLQSISASVSIGIINTPLDTTQQWLFPSVSSPSALSAQQNEQVPTLTVDNDNLLPNADLEKSKIDLLPEKTEKILLEETNTGKDQISDSSVTIDTKITEDHTNKIDDSNLEKKPDEENTHGELFKLDLIDESNRSRSPQPKTVMPPEWATTTHPKIIASQKKKTNHLMPGQYLGGGHHANITNNPRMRSPSPPSMRLRETNNDIVVPPTEPNAADAFTEPIDNITQSPGSVHSRSGHRKQHIHSPGELLHPRNPPSNLSKSRKMYNENEEDTAMPELMQLDAVHDITLDLPKPTNVSRHHTIRPRGNNNSLQDSNTENMGYIWEDFMLSRIKMTKEVQTSSGREDRIRSKKRRQDKNKDTAVEDVKSSIASEKTRRKSQVDGSYNRGDKGNNLNNDKMTNNNNNNNNNNKKKRTASKYNNEDTPTFTLTKTKSTGHLTPHPRKNSNESCVDKDNTTTTKGYYESGVEKDLFTLLLRRFSGFSKSILYSILINRPVVILAASPVSMRSKIQVSKIVKALSLLIPGAPNESHVEEWRVKPLNIHDLSSLKLVGMPSHVCEKSPEILWEWVTVIQIKNDTDDLHLEGSNNPNFNHSRNITPTDIVYKRRLSDEIVSRHNNNNNNNIKYNHNNYGHQSNRMANINRKSSTKDYPSSHTATAFGDNTIPKEREQDTFFGPPYHVHSHTHSSLIFGMLHPSKRFKNDPNLFYRCLSRRLLAMSLHVFLFYWMSQYALPHSSDFDPVLHYQQLLLNLNFEEAQDLDIAKHWCHIMQRQLYELVVHKSIDHTISLSSSLPFYSPNTLLDTSRKKVILAQFANKIPPITRLRDEMQWNLRPVDNTDSTKKTTNQKKPPVSSNNKKKKKEKSSWLQFWK